MCHKYVPGMRMFDFTYDTPWLTGRRFYEQAGGRKCILMFLRYIGCSTCNLEMLTLRRDYMRFQAKKVKLFVVLQSEPATLRDYWDENFFPFDYSFLFHLYNFFLNSILSYCLISPNYKLFLIKFFL